MHSNKLIKAIKFAIRLHRDQKRVCGTPYIIHPLSVMSILERHGFDEEALIIAVLHDICEDTCCNNIELADIFGEQVGFAIQSLSKNKKGSCSVCKSEKEKNTNYRLLMYINRLHLGALANPVILFVKMADQINNLSSIEVFKITKQKRIIKEVENSYLPMYDKIASTFNNKDLISKFKRLKKELLQELNTQKEKIGVIED